LLPAAAGENPSEVTEAMRLAGDRCGVDPREDDELKLSSVCLDDVGELLQMGDEDSVAATKWCCDEGKLCGPNPRDAVLSLCNSNSRSLDSEVTFTDSGGGWF